MLLCDVVLVENISVQYGKYPTEMTDPEFQCYIVTSQKILIFIIKYFHQVIILIVSGILIENFVLRI
jgi:hypothetical protein